MRAVAVCVTPFALILFSAVGSVMQTTRTEDVDKREIVALEKAWADAGPARDVAAYERGLADDFIGQWADGSSSNKAETIESLRNLDHYDDVNPSVNSMFGLQRDCCGQRPILKARHQRREGLDWRIHLYRRVGQA